MYIKYFLISLDKNNHADKNGKSTFTCQRARNRPMT
jgi:hypothetical protein